MEVVQTKKLLQNKRDINEKKNQLTELEMKKIANHVLEKGSISKIYKTHVTQF